MSNKSGRPKLLDAEKKTGRIEIKCYTNEKQEIVILAKSFGLNISDYMIRKALNRKVSYNHIALLNEVHQIGTELSRAGNNINQLAKNANRLNKAGILTQTIVTQMNVMLEDYNQQQEQIRVMLRKIIREIGKT